MGTAPYPASPAEEIARAARLLMDHGATHEVRILHGDRGRRLIHSGYYSDPELLAEDAARYDGRAGGIYITVNPVLPAVAARAYNRIAEHASITTSDAEIARRVWLLIDCDPVRPAGISSTDAEHGRAITTACGIWDDLRTVGWPDPVVADSGNGAHLLYRVDLPNTEKVTAILKRVLAGIAARCAPEDIAVDPTVFNPARICKLYGTLTRKGDSTPDRPHRRSRLLEIPKRLVPITIPEVM